MNYRQNGITPEKLEEAGYRRYKSGEPHVDALFQKPMQDDAGRTLFFLNFRLFDFSQYSRSGGMSPGFDVSFDAQCQIRMVHGFINAEINLDPSMTIKDVEQVAVRVFDGVDHVAYWRRDEEDEPKGGDAK